MKYQRLTEIFLFSKVKEKFHIKIFILKSIAYIHYRIQIRMKWIQIKNEKNQIVSVVIFHYLTNVMTVTVNVNPNFTEGKSSYSPTAGPAPGRGEEPCHTAQGGKF